MKAEYLRKSRAEELMDSTEEVLAKHRAFLAEFAAVRGIIIDDVYEEVVSGESIYARPQMQRLLSAVRDGKYDAVLCMDIDRLGRGGMQDQGEILDAFRESGTLIITPDKTYDLSNETDEQLTEFKAFMSRQEYKIIRKRMRRGLMQTIEAGGYCANPPYGYKKCVIDRLPSLEIVPEEAKFIRHIYARYLEGVGAHTISQELNAMGSVPRRNAVWNKNTVREVLRNPTYKGMVAWNRVKHYRPGSSKYDKQHVVYMPETEWIMAPGKHAAIISPEDWDKAQEVRRSRYIPSQNTGVVKNPLAGLIVCANCGHRMQRMSMNKEPYLLCNTTGCCAGAKLEYVEEVFMASLRDRLDRLRVEAAAASAPDTTAEQALLSGIAAEMSKLDARENRLYDFLEDGTYDRDTFRARMQELQQRKNALQAQKEAAEQKLSRLNKENLKAAAAELENVLSLYPTVSPAEQNALLKTVIDKVVYSKAKKTKPRDFTLRIYPRNFDW